MIIKRCGIYLAALDPAIGHEIKKTRPVLVISNDKANEYSGTATILPITSRSLDRVYPFEVFIKKGKGNLPKDSKIKADQIRTIDQKRLIKHIGSLNQAEMKIIAKAIKIHLAMDDN